MKQECAAANGVEYQQPSETEEPNETKTRRRKMRHKLQNIAKRKKEQKTEQAARCRRRQENKRFRRHERYLKQACEIIGARESKRVNYVGPADDETPAATKARRRMLRRKLAKTDVEYVCCAEEYPHRQIVGKDSEPTAIKDLESIDVTSILLNFLGLSWDFTEAPACTTLKLNLRKSSSSEYMETLYMEDLDDDSLADDVVQFYEGKNIDPRASVDDESLDSIYSISHPDNQPTFLYPSGIGHDYNPRNCKCNIFDVGRLDKHRYCREIGEHGMQFFSGHRRVIEPGRRKYKTVCIASNYMKKINIDGEALRALADEITGPVEGLSMKRTIRVLNGEQRVIDPNINYVGQERHPTMDVDIERIECIENGTVHLDQRQEKKKFSITAQGGKITLAYESFYSAKYRGDPDDNYHLFRLWLEPMQVKYTFNVESLLSCEVRINDCFLTGSTLGECQKFSYRNMRWSDAIYKQISHMWDVDYWFDELSVDVLVGPLDASEEETETTVIEDIEDKEELNALLRNVYAPLFSSRRPWKEVVFICVDFTDNILEKSSILHSLALTKLKENTTTPT